MLNSNSKDFKDTFAMKDLNNLNNSFLNQNDVSYQGLIGVFNNTQNTNNQQQYQQPSINL